jgi:hypothetical protein
LGCDQRPDLDVVKQVLAYFVRHPHSADDLEGVSRWRLLETAVRTRVEETHDALKWLVGRGFLDCVTTPGSTTVFRLNTAASEKIRAFLDTEAASSHSEPHGEPSHVGRPVTSLAADPSQGETSMPATLTNKSRSLVTVELKSGEWVHLAPGETSRLIDDVEVHQNDRLAKLIDRKLVALARPDAEQGAKSDEPRARTSKR